MDWYTKSGQQNIILVIYLNASMALLCKVFVLNPSPLRLTRWDWPDQIQVGWKPFGMRGFTDPFARANKAWAWRYVWCTGNENGIHYTLLTDSVLLDSWLRSNKGQMFTLWTILWSLMQESFIMVHSLKKWGVHVFRLCPTKKCLTTPLSKSLQPSQALLFPLCMSFFNPLLFS